MDQLGIVPDPMQISEWLPESLLAAEAFTAAGFDALRGAVLGLFAKAVGELFKGKLLTCPWPAGGSEKGGKVYGESFPVRPVIEASLA